MRLTETQALEILRVIMTTRAIEERLIRLYHQGKIYGGVYTGYGQEGTGAAIAALAGPHDLFAPCIRNLSLHIGRGETPLNVFRQWLGREKGPTGGRDGNVHFGNMDHGVYTMISHLGAMIPVVAGGTLARRRQGRDSVGFAFIGDGGTSTGDFHEAVNFAAVRDIPLVVIIENNHYAYSTPSAHQYRCRNLIDKAIGYGIEGVTVDGNDALAMAETLRPHIDDLRRTPRPLLVEADTMRMRGHGEHDDFSYVPKELLETYAARDPILVCRKRLLEAGLLDAAGAEAIRETCAAGIEQAYRTALAESRPHPSTLCHGVYADG
ncbi:MAG TPA: thiamine pyrophosphate-dependent dehydrogenase E1 component subunit alpha [Kiritimatiellia bacterium]|nr:thiamine pyrophosphate-dependent dehydrogenase E1 component subunit alpha [Kiritimatiellia bacterium]